MNRKINITNIKKIRLPTRLTSLFIIFDIFLVIMLLALLLDKDFLGQKPLGSNSKLNQINKEAKTIASICLEPSDKQKCHGENLSHLVQKYDFSFAENTLYALQKIDPYARACHVTAHKMGEAALKKQPDKLQELSNSINVTVCGSGFMHGILEAYLGLNPNTKIDGEFNNTFCGNLENRYRINMCSHFLGHVFLTETYGDFQKAFPNCQNSKPHLQYDCFDGLFMEEHQKNILYDHGLSDLPRYTPQYLKKLQTNCQLYQGDAAKGCWTEIAEVATKTLGYEPQKIYNECRIAPNTDLQKKCYLKGVVVIITYTREPTTETLVKICQPYLNDEADYKNCINWLISALMHYSYEFTPRGIRACTNMPMLNESCFKELGNQLKTLYPSLTQSQKEILCHEAPSQYKGLCLNR